VVVILQLMVIQAMAASADLHHRLHPHSDDHSHHCVVTLMQSGGYDVVVPDKAPVDFIPEPPDMTVAGPVERDVEPSHLSGGVLAHSPPRGP
jgi:hypothetical protein